MLKTHAPADDGTPPPCGNRAARFVVVHDPKLKTSAAVDEVAALCESTDGDFHIALVGLAHHPDCQAPILDAIRRLKSDGHVVVCYAPGAHDWPVGAQCRLLLAGASHVFDSSASTFRRELHEWVREAIGTAIEHDRENRHLRQQMLGLGMVGASAAMIAVFRWIVRASAVTDLPVLIGGETGTGKELAARAIHRLDARRCDRPFIAVNCGAISAALAESELFGHRRGAFTGAEHDRLGLIRAARGGVLFLDEIGDLEPHLQGKLLRVLQEGRVLALGDDHELPVDVRIIAASNRNIEEMVTRHEFRADLFHRLNALSLRIPPLRERPDDIEPLVEHLLARRTDDHGAPVRASQEFIEALRRLKLPGNVRQLEHLVRRAVVTTYAGQPLRLRSLPPELWAELSHGDNGARGATTSRDTTTPVDATAVLNASEWKLQRALDLCEQQLLTAALGASSGNRARAARLLGISPRCIFNKMRKHRLTA